MSQQDDYKQIELDEECPECGSDETWGEFGQDDKGNPVLLCSCCICGHLWEREP